MILATIERITRVIEKETGRVYEQVKTEEIQIGQLSCIGKKFNFDFRYVTTGKGDAVMGLKEIQQEQKV